MVLFDEYKNRICPEFTTPKQEDSITKQEDRFAENGAGKKKESQWIYTHCNSTFAIVSTLASSYCDNGSSHSGNTHTVISPLTAFQNRLRRPRRLQYWFDSFTVSTTSVILSIHTGHFDNGRRWYDRDDYSIDSIRLPFQWHLWYCLCIQDILTMAGQCYDECLLVFFLCEALVV